MNISFCIVCMNRLHQIKETLLHNMELYVDRNNVEFILLDYNSQDGLEEWAKKNLQNYINSGFLTYYRTPEPELFSHSHSKNMVFKLASGDILCSINADHYIGRDFDQYLKNVFEKTPYSFVSPYIPPSSKQKYIPPRDVMGKVCLKRSDFYAVSGFDERFKNYGFEDVDLVKRLEAHGLRRNILNNAEFLKFIEHGDDERVHITDASLVKLFIRYISSCESEVIYLYKDQTYERMIFVRTAGRNCHKFVYAFKKRTSIYSFSIKGNYHERGFWTVQPEYIYTLSRRNIAKSFREYDGGIIDDSTGETFFQIQNDENLITLNTMRRFMENLSIMRNNIYKKRIKVNRNQYGSGIVFKNFHHQQIHV